MCDDADFRPYHMSYSYRRGFVCDIQRKENAVLHNEVLVKIFNKR